MKKLDEANPEPRGQLQLRVLAKPSDANPNGDISGGWLVTQMDSAASIVSYRVTNGRTATMAISDMSFVRPIKVGAVVCVYTEVTSVGGSSVKIHVEVWSRSPKDNSRQKVTEAEFVFVAIDDNRRIRRLESSGSVTAIN